MNIAHRAADAGKSRFPLDPRAPLALYAAGGLFGLT